MSRSPLQEIEFSNKQGDLISKGESLISQLRHSTQPLRVGVPQSGYNIDRNILASLPAGSVRVRPFDVFRLRSSLRYRLTGALNQYEQFRFSAFHMPRVDVLHFFNSTSAGSTPWVTTFGTSMPRWGEVPRGKRLVGLRFLLSDNCKRLIAMSDAARHIAAMEWEELAGPSAASELLSKTEVLLPPQAVSPAQTPRSQDGITRFAFVGADFYRKGGLEFLRALRRLQERGCCAWRAAIIGRLDSYGDYGSGTDANSMREACDLLQLLKPLVSHKDRSSREEVRQIMCEADFFVFPTLADTFGYVVLEAQAHGAIVISTNVRALPEVNSAATGLLIRVPLDSRREFHRHKELGIWKARLVEDLEQCLLEALKMPSERRRELALAAVMQLRARHDPLLHRQRILGFYEGALSSRA